MLHLAVKGQQQTAKEARMKISAASIIFCACFDWINCLEVWGTTLPPGFVREEGPYVDLFEGIMSLFNFRNFTNDVIGLIGRTFFNFQLDVVTS